MDRISIMMDTSNCYFPLNLTMIVGDCSITMKDRSRSVIEEEHGAHPNDTNLFEVKS